MALYVSKDSTAGQPVKADFGFKTGDGTTPNGYMPLANFGREIAENLNKYDYDVNGIYLFYKQDKSYVGIQQIQYLSNIYLQTGKSETECIHNLEAAGYTVINTNLTPDSEEETYTYLGYKITFNKSNALTDIRVCDKYNAGSFLYGSVSYGEHGTSDGITLYATKMSPAG